MAASSRKDGTLEQPSKPQKGRRQLRPAHPGVPARPDPQHRDHGAHRRGQDHDDRADPLLHRQDLQDRRGPRRLRRHGLDGPGAGARHHDHLRRDHRAVEGPLDQHHRHARATSTSPSRSSAASACSTARSRSSTPSRASSRRRRPSGARPTGTTSRAICFINKMDRTGADFDQAVQMIKDRLVEPHPVPIQLPWGNEENFVGVIDLVEMKALRWPTRAWATSGRPSTSPTTCAKKAEAARNTHHRGPRRGRARRRDDDPLRRAAPSRPPTSSALPSGATR